METSSLFSPREFLLATRDAGYAGLASAIAELVDNSIQAGARRVWIAVDNQAPSGGSPTVVVSDDGIGMCADALHRALRFGWSSRFDDRNGTGRFGMGLPNASLSHARRVEVFTRRRGEPLMWTCLDLDEIRVHGKAIIPPPRSAANWPHLADRDQGTTVVWKKCDRVDVSRLNTLIGDLGRELGRIFRFYLWDGISLLVNGTPIKSMDPLFLRRNRHGIRGRQYGPALQFSIASVTGKAAKVSVRFSELPIRSLSALPNNRKQQLGLLDNPGVSVVRCRREIDRGWYFMGSKRRQNYDNWWRCEVCFDPALDELFGVTHTKQGVNPTRPLRQILTPSIEKIARELSTRARAEFALQAIHRTAATRAVEKKDILLEPPVHIARLSETGHCNFTTNSRSRKCRLGLKFAVENHSVADVHFFNVRLSGHELLVSLNADHAFYERFYSRLSAHPTAATGPIIKHIEVMLLAAGRAETLLTSTAERLQLNRFRGLWSQILSTYLG